MLDLNIQNLKKKKNNLKIFNAYLYATTSNS